MLTKIFLLNIFETIQIYLLHAPKVRRNHLYRVQLQRGPRSKKRRGWRKVIKGAVGNHFLGVIILENPEVLNRDVKLQNQEVVGSRVGRRDSKELQKYTVNGKFHV